MANTADLAATSAAASAVASAADLAATPSQYEAKCDAQVPSWLTELQQFLADDQLDQVCTRVS
jgi:hypothetical protein